MRPLNLLKHGYLYIKMEHQHVKKLFLNRLINNLIALVAIVFLQSPFLISAQAAGSSSSSIRNLLIDDSGSGVVLPPEVAFKLNLTAIDAQNIQANFTIVPGHYLYRERIKFTVQSPKEIKIAEISLPTGEIKEDANFGKQEVYRHDFKVNIKLNSASNQAVTINASYQGCSEKGLCYAPIKKTISVDTSVINNTNVATTATNDNEADNTIRILKSGNLWLIIAGFFVAGLLLSLTPCVLPMIPILSSIIVGSQSKQSSQTVKSSKLHAFALSVAYVFGMALTYTLAGVAAGLSGDLLSQSLQNAWVLGATSLIFVLLAFSMFGFYELKLPQSFEDKMLSASNKLQGGHFLGVFIMGVLSALIVSPCVAAPLAGALIYIGQTHNVLLGGIGLFALAIGMGMPLLLIGASAGSLLPKTGNWMNAVSNFFGVIMLGMAIWLVSPVISIGVQLALWSALLIVTAVYHNALDNLPAHASNFSKVGKGIAVILLIFGVALLIGALSGAKSALQPLNAFTANAGSQFKKISSLAFTRITSIAELEKKLAETKGQPIMLDFYADWCVACKELENLTFSDQKVQEQLKNTTLLQVDVTANTDEDKALLKRFGLYGPPGIAFFNGSGQEMTTLKTVGFQDADRFSATLAKRDSCILSPPNSKTATIQC
jgi:thiol:disulfide interchange protein DsbD